MNTIMILSLSHSTISIDKSANEQTKGCRDGLHRLHTAFMLMHFQECAKYAVMDHRSSSIFTSSLLRKNVVP